MKHSCLLSPRRALPFLLVFLAVPGCGTSTYPVEGTIFFEDGKPAKELAGGFVHFEPLQGKTSALGEIRSDGTYRIYTSKKDDGAIPGKYRVTVSPPPLPNPEKPGKPILHSKFLNVDTSKLEFTVEARKNQWDIRVERAKK